MQRGHLLPFCLYSAWLNLLQALSEAEDLAARHAANAKVQAWSQTFPGMEQRGVTAWSESNLQYVHDQGWANYEKFVSRLAEGTSTSTITLKNGSKVCYTTFLVRTGLTTESSGAKVDRYFQLLEIGGGEEEFFQHCRRQVYLGPFFHENVPRTL